MTAVPKGFSVVVCVHTEERWQDILDAVGSLGAQTLPPLEILLVVDHHPVLLERLERHFADGPHGVRVLPNDGPRGLSAGRKHPKRGRGRPVRTARLPGCADSQGRVIELG
ncbi:glycosyltransferase, partial [Streptomyces albidoflavus]